MQRVLGNQANLFYALLRFAAGLMLTLHGMQKLFGALAGHQPPLLSQLWIGGLLELVGGILVAVGFHASFAAFVLSGMMAVAYFQFHHEFDFADPRFWPVVNKGELAVLYSFVFLLIAARGSGGFSVDRLLKR